MSGIEQQCGATMAEPEVTQMNQFLLFLGPKANITFNSMQYEYSEADFHTYIFKEMLERRIKECKCYFF